MSTFTKSQWFSGAEYILSSDFADDVVKDEEWVELLQVLWDALPEKFNRRVLQFLESKVQDPY